MENKWTFNELAEGMWDHDEFDKKEQAEGAARKYFDTEQEVFYVGQIRLIPLPITPNIESIFDDLDEDYGVDIEDYDDYLFDGVTKNQEDWLEKKLEKLMSEFYEFAKIKSNKYLIKNISEIKL